MHISELDLSPATLACLKAADIYLVDQLLEHGSGDLIQHPKFCKGLELYEIICELHRHGLTFSRYGQHIQTEREREMFRLRAVTGLTLDEIGERFKLSRGRIHQLLRLHFHLDVVPPAAKARRPPPPSLRKHTLIERRRLYLLASVAIKRHYRKPLTVEMVAKALATSPRQIGCFVDRGLDLGDVLGPVGVGEQVCDGQVLEQERPGQSAVMRGLCDERPAR